jgi:hypothetical protein
MRLFGQEETTLQPISETTTTKPIFETNGKIKGSRVGTPESDFTIL